MVVEKGPPDLPKCHGARALRGRREDTEPKCAAAFGPFLQQPTPGPGGPPAEGAGRHCAVLPAEDSLLHSPAHAMQPTLGGPAEEAPA